MNQQLIEENMNLVYSIVSKEYPTYLYDEDIIQSGMLGLCKAASTWNEGKAKFSTYAWRCIRNEINQEFIRRKSMSQVWSLDNPIGEDGTLSDIVVGDTDVQYVDDTFFDTLTSAEGDVLALDLAGYSTEEIAQLTGFAVSRVRKLLRTVRIKRKNFDESC